MKPDAFQRVLVEILHSQHDQLVNRWLSEVHADESPPGNLSGNAYRDLLRQHATRILQELAQTLSDNAHDWRLEYYPHFCQVLREISAQQAKQGFSPTKSTHWILGLKKALQVALNEQLVGQGEALMLAIKSLDQIVDSMLVFVINSFVEAREKVILQQSIALMEQSIPVVRVWNRILMMTLIGVIDTQRARQLTERLLENVSKTEALVTIIDVTGVPVLDTSVAGHLLKTIAAANMLGTQVIMTGINPEGAQTLVKLGINFPDITTRATLRSGLAEALRMIGYQVIPLQQGTH